jgi:hypothetical protein
MHFLFRSGMLLNPALPFLENGSLHVPPSNLREFSLFDVCPANNPYPSARCTYTAKAVDKDLDVFTIRAVSLNHIYTQPKTFIIICSHSYCFCVT